MENASKALLISAAILVVIIIIALGIKILSTTDTQKTGEIASKTINQKTEEAMDIATGEMTGNKIIYYEGETEKTKPKSEVHSGDTIKIGTEKLVIILVDNEGIKAMPYYNLVKETESGGVKQGPPVTGKSTYISTSFSTINYWNQADDPIQMINEPRNNVQQYIMSYEATLSKMGASNIDVRAVRKDEMTSNSTAVKKIKSGSFWLATATPLGNTNIWYANGGSGGYSGAKFDTNKGVRPIIIIH